ncbi:MAG: DedA family protein [Chlamydiia bacterium]|nr:DedA family protein [Chlamydiia bacterium]
MRTSAIYTWATAKANSSRAPFWVGLIFFLEIFLFLPLDALLIFFCLQNRKNTWVYVLMAAAASTLSGLMGYFVGHFLWDLVGSYVVPHLISASTFQRVSGHFQDYEKWAVFFGSLLPFPLKALSIGAGVFQLGPATFALWMFLARLVRFSLSGLAMVFYGDKVKQFVDKHFGRIIMIIGAKVAAAFLFFWILAR